MRMLVRSEGFEAPSALQEYVIQRLTFLLKPFEDDIEQITVHLENRDASRSDVRKTCRIVVNLRCKTVTVEEQKSHFSVALDVALKRLLYNISSSLVAEREVITSAVSHENRE